MCRVDGFRVRGWVVRLRFMAFRKILEAVIVVCRVKDYSGN